NCAAIPESLLESELFGHERGAFTGALSRKQGRFEIAQDGTVFLDEVTEMSLSVQAKFLRVLQERTFERLGSLTPIRTNARVIAATNRDLRSMVEERTFREDLYYRLNVFPVHIPPLRERRDHIATVAHFLLQKLSARLGKEGVTLSADSLDKIMHYHWPGNIRELENVLERAIIVSKGREIVLPALEIRAPEQEVAPNMLVDLKTMEKAAIEKALRTTKGNRRGAAELLGISVRALQYKIKEYGINL
ncbi:MAG TPA: sigma 54-interacting transcriptional regulator, partial [Dissulfurispiraceae bacterium]|nr:sigma 54-interacting transcriptional regulator [Dissulfurispiraceae bacterium]